MMKVPLTSLKNGESGVISSTCFNPRNKHRHRKRKGQEDSFMTARCVKRLTDLGLTPGTKVTVVKSAPFSGPLEICVRGSKLAIGRGMANKILVDVNR